MTAPRYPVLVAELAQSDLERLAAVAELTVATIELLAAGEHPATPEQKSRLAAALDHDEADLFRLPDPVLDEHLARVGYVTDPAALRAIDGAA